MQFDSWSEFVAMGGHALYVWLAYGATLLVLLGSYAAVRAARKQVVSELRWSADESAPGAARGAQQEFDEEENKL